MMQQRVDYPCKVNQQIIIGDVLNDFHYLLGGELLVQLYDAVDGRVGWVLLRVESETDDQREICQFFDLWVVNLFG